MGAWMCDGATCEPWTIRAVVCALAVASCHHSPRDAERETWAAYVDGYMSELDDYLKACPDHGASQADAIRRWREGLTVQQMVEVSKGQRENPSSTTCVTWVWPPERLVALSARWRAACGRCAAPGTCSEHDRPLRQAAPESHPDFAALARLRDAPACR
jgi:hypothetical protein